MTKNCNKCKSDLTESTDDPISSQTLEFMDNKYELCINCCLKLKVWISGDETESAEMF